MSQRHEPSTSTDSFLSQRLPFLPEWMSINVAMLVLMVVFFLVPFALRGARMSLESMKNDVKDWLPASFDETKDLDWFRLHFLGEQFELVAYPGMTGLKDDQRFKLFIDKLFPEIPPSNQKRFPQPDEQSYYNEQLGMYVRSMDPDYMDYRRHYLRKAGEPLPTGPATEEELKNSTEFVGDKWGLYVAPHSPGDDPYHTNWGGQGEKWLKGQGNIWYYLKEVADPGDYPSEPAATRYALFRWDGGNTMLGGAYRSLLQKVAGISPVSGDLVRNFHPADGKWFFEDPRRLQAQWFKTIVSGPSVLGRLIGESGGGSLKLTEEEARRRLQGSLFGKDLGNGVQQTCIVVTLTDAARKELAQTIGRGMLGKPRGQLYTVANEVGLADDEIKFGGPPVDNVAIDEEGQITLVQLIWYSAAVGIFLSYFLLRSVYQTMMVFFVGGICAVLALALVYWTGSSVDAVLLTMPALVYVLGISGTIHIINHYRQAAIEEGIVGAPERAVAHSWLPALLCNLTTALGLMSLCTSDIIPIYKFGLFSALGCMVGTILLFTYLPAALEVWPTAKTKEEDREEHEEAVRHPTTWQKIEQWWEHLMESIPGRVCDFLLANYITVSITCFILTIVFSSGAIFLRTEIQLLKMFSSDTKIIRDYAWLEDNLGKLVPMEIVVRVDPKLIRNVVGEDDKPLPDTPENKFQLNMLDRMRMIEILRADIESEFGDESDRDVVGRGMAATSFAPALPPPGKDAPGSLKRAYYLYARNLEKHRQEFIDSDYLREEKTDRSDLWRISLRIAALDSVDPGFFVKALESAVEPALHAYGAREQILRAIDAKRGGMDKNFYGRKVVLLGARLPTRVVKPAPPAGQPEAKLTDEERTKLQDARVQELSFDRQTQLFVAQLQATLMDAGIQVVLHYPENKAAHLAEIARDEYSPGELKKYDKNKNGLIDDAEKTALIDDVNSAPDEALDADWAEKRLGSADCVAWVDKLAAYDQAVVAKAAQPIDVTKHLYVHGDEGSTTRGLDKLAKDQGQASTGVYAIYTGIVPVVYKTQRTLLESLNESFVWSLATITPTMMLILVPWGSLGAPLYRAGSFWSRLKRFGYRCARGGFFAFCGGFIAMWPNVFPVAIVFGLMGYLGIKIDIGTMMTASVAVGIAVDDTLHFLTFYRDGLNAGKTKEQAIHDAYQKCAVAFIQTALIAGCGLGVFAFSSFTPTQRFGGMMLVLLLTAVFGDLLFMPSLLAGPLGWFFQPDQHDEDDEPLPPSGEDGSQAAGDTAGPAKEPAKEKPGAHEPVLPTPVALAAEGLPVATDLDDPLPGEPADPGRRAATLHSKLRDETSRRYRTDRPHDR